jgi:predicted dehydrogenase
MEQKIKVCIIGLGKMGISHLAILGANSSVEVVGVCDNSKIVTAFLKKQTPFDVYDDFRKMINESKPDAVIVSVPTQYHAEIIEELLESRINVFSEKPLTTDAEISKRLADKSKNARLVSQVGYHNHFIGTFIEMKRLIDNRVLGDLYHFTAEAYGPVVIRAKESTWRSNLKEGGGCLFDYASHVIDLINFSLGEIVNISEVELKKVFSIGVEDAVYGKLQLISGLSGILSVNWSDPTYRKMSTKFTIIGRNGKLIVDATELKLYLCEPIKDENYEIGWNVISVGALQQNVHFYLRGEEYTSQLDYFFDSIRRKRYFGENNFEEAAKTDHAIQLIRLKS